MKEWILTSLLLCGLVLGILAQEVADAQMISGSVSEVTIDGTQAPLIGANVYWLGSSIGTTTDLNGLFEVSRPKGADQLIFSFIGYQSDTIQVSASKSVDHIMRTSVVLGEVEITHRQRTTEISYMDPMKVEKISEKELLKAACCNLSESFETNPSVDVSFTDAVTGTRQIQLLGLAGPYAQISRENMPDIRGLSAMYGMTYVPGHWIEGIQMAKGMGSVVNGYESITGQINVELRKPETAPPLYLNVFANEGGRVEVNLNLAQQLSGDQWSTATLLHGASNGRRADRNQDGFLDNPIGPTFIGLHRWKYAGSRGLRMQIGVKGTYIDRTGGQLEYTALDDPASDHLWGMNLNTKRLEGWAKIGQIFEDTPWKSVGLQVSGAMHRQVSHFGQRQYDASQRSLYGNLVYQTIIGNTNHKLKTGASIQYDDYTEQLEDHPYDRLEVVPGAYLEYTYDHLERFSIVAGVRVDHHNLFGAFVTPRLHMRYAPSEMTVLRASIGRGQRTANIIAENNGLLASSRQVIIESEGLEQPYGLDQEMAWSMGANITQSFSIDYREGTMSVDFYRTMFDNQIVVDLDRDPQSVYFYNLDGTSYSNSLQAQVDYELANRLDLRMAYRWFDVKTTYGDDLLQKPLVSAHRAFTNIGYETTSDWKIDYTINWQGQKRIPYTGSNPEAYQLPETSPSFVLMNAQISKMWHETFEIYLGVQNILNYTQDSPILASDQPYSEYFDSALVWGPIFGRNTYIGLRYKIF